VPIDTDTSHLCRSIEHGAGGACSQLHGIMTLVKNSRIVWLAACLIVLSFLPQFSFGNPELSDAQKRQIVYRMYADYKKDFPAVQDVSPQEAMALLKSDQVVFVDVRTPEEMKVSMLPQAVSRQEFQKDPARYAGKKIVAYCTISYRSGKFAQEMTRQGITVYNLTGGILAWTLEGGKVYDARGETKRIHPTGTIRPKAIRP
jgi:rhodanese-related sulfurtransferase